MSKNRKEKVDKNEIEFIKEAIYERDNDYSDLISSTIGEEDRKRIAYALAGSLLFAGATIMGMSLYNDYHSSPKIKNFTVNPETGHVHALIEDGTKFFDDRITDVDIEIKGKHEDILWFNVKPIDGKFDSKKEIIDDYLPGFPHTFREDEYNITLIAKDSTGNVAKKTIKYKPKIKKEEVDIDIRYDNNYQLLDIDIDLENIKNAIATTNMINQQGKGIYHLTRNINEDSINKEIYLDEVFSKEILEDKKYTFLKALKKDIERKWGISPGDIIKVKEYVYNDKRAYKSKGKNFVLNEKIVNKLEFENEKGYLDVYSTNWFDYFKEGNISLNAFVIDKNSKRGKYSNLESVLEKNEDVIKTNDGYIVEKRDMKGEIRIYKPGVIDFKEKENITVESLDDLGRIVNKIEKDLGVNFDVDKYYDVKEANVLLTNKTGSNTSAKLYVINFGKTEKEASIEYSQMDEQVARFYLDTHKGKEVKNVTDVENFTHIYEVKDDEIEFEKFNNQNISCLGNNKLKVSYDSGFYDVYLPKLEDRNVCEFVEMKPKKRDGTYKNYEVLYIFDPESEEPKITTYAEKKMIDVLYDAISKGSVDIYEMPDKDAIAIISYDPSVEYPGARYRGDKIFVGDKDEVKKYGRGGRGEVETASTPGSSSNPPAGGDNGSGGSGLG